MRAAHLPGNDDDNVVDFNPVASAGNGIRHRLLLRLIAFNLSAFALFGPAPARARLSRLP